MDISAYKHMNIRMSTRGKRPLRNLTPSDKVRAIQRIHNGETKASVSRDIGVPESTLRGWCKNEQKLRFMCRQLGTDQMLVRGQNSPPEKRLKFDGVNPASQKTGLGSGNCTDFEYNRLQLGGGEFIAGSDILEKIAFTEFFQKTASLARPEVGRLSSSQVNPASKEAAMSAEYSQLAMLQNFNFLSLLNLSSPTPSLGPNKSVGASCQLKLPIPGESINVDDPLNISNGSSSCERSGNSPVLSVKNWARDPVKKSKVIQSSEGSGMNVTSKTNGDVKPGAQGQFPLSGLISEVPLMPHIIPTNPSAVLNSPQTTESANNALMDWCKLFNASLHYLALSAAAAALQHNVATGFGTNETPCGKDNQEGFSDNILLKRLANGNSTSHSFQGKRTGASDISNDSYFDSEPEDLSVPSTSSKRSSSSNSCSQSPTLIFSSSMHSDAD